MREAFIQGNIYDENFVNVWEKSFKTLRDREWTKNGRCTECKEYKWCDGGGLHLREGLNREASNCAFSKYS